MEAEAARNKKVEAPDGETPVVPEATVPVLQEVVPDPQTELGLGEPPNVVAEQPSDWAHRPTEAQLKQWWEEFSATQTPRISSLLRTVTPKMDGEEVVIAVPPSRIEPLEPVKFPFNRFISEVSGGVLKKLRVEAGEMEQMERKPYTEKEKLEYLQKKNPKIGEIIDKLDLKLP